MAYFFAQHVTPSDDGSSPRLFDFVFDIWRPARTAAEREQDGVMAAVIAVGLAGLSGLMGCAETKEWAQTSYGAALYLTNQTLHVPGEAIKDATMLSVLLLSTYEMMTGRSPQAVCAWQGHVDGAATLATMRGAGLFASEAGVRMFDTLSHITFVNCVQMALPMPPALVKLRRELQDMPLRGSNWTMPVSFYKVLQLRYDIKSGALTHRYTIIEHLVAADQDLSRLTDELPEGWKYRVVHFLRGHEAVLGDSCHVYASPTHSMAWNRLWSMRMLVHETIIGEVLKSLVGHGIESLPFKHRLQISRSVQLLEKLRDAILASVPQHMGVVGLRDTSPSGRENGAVNMVKARRPAWQLSSPLNSDQSSASSTSTGVVIGLLSQQQPAPFNLAHKGGSPDDAGAEKFMTLAAASNTIVWPLYLVGMSFSCTPEVKDYIVARLLAIHESTGLKEAYSVAKMVAAKEILVPWPGLPLEDTSLFNLKTALDAV